MASSQPNYFNFPHFPPPPPSHSFSPPPPPPSHGPPPPHKFSPPPPPSHGPPPPPHQFSPPPPHPRPHPPPSPFHPIVHPPPPSAPLPPPPSPNNHPIVIVIVFVSLGGFMLLSLLAFALFCSIKKAKKKKTKKTQETDIIHLDEHKKIKETIVTGPLGQQAVVLTIEDDVHIDEKIIKNEEKVGHSLHAESHQGNSKSEEKKKNQESDIIHADEHKKIKETVVNGPFGTQAMVLSIEDDVHIDEEINKNEEKDGHNLHATSSNDQGNSNSLDAGTTTSDHEHHQLENKP
ncbi:hypothetical protein RIF29_11584 [Crotalaria pallida]|uniref:Uncharacterized protein n=1 Tax=Crotalaria pallida TaxID=3830 RepID=A0AAN9IMB0_CROPI